MPEAIKFIEQWIDANVNPAVRGGSSMVALDLADRCRDAAANEGINLGAAELKFGNLEKIIYEAMHFKVGTPSA